MSKEKIKMLLKSSISTKNRRIFLFLSLLAAILPVFIFIQIVLSGKSVISESWFVFGALVFGYSLPAMALTLQTYKRIDKEYMFVLVFCVVFFGAVWSGLALSMLGAAD